MSARRSSCPNSRAPKRANALAIAVAVGFCALLAYAPAPYSGAPAHPAGSAVQVPFVSNPTAGWLSVTPPTGPSPALRSGAALAYDPVDGYTVLFGGCNHHICPYGDTWRYAGGAWTNLTSSLRVAPAPRQGAALVYDPRDGYLLLFGGLGASGALGDTWRFSGGTWTAIPFSATATPPARAFAQVAFVSSLNSVVLFGGSSSVGSVLSDTWNFGSGSWSTGVGPGSSGAAPASRSNGVMADDPLDGYAVLFGGTGACGRRCADTWGLSTAGWTNLTTSTGVPPVGRVNTTLVYDPGRGALLLFGGSNGSALSDTWGFSQGTWRSMTSNLSGSPGARYGASATYDAADGYLLLFGGTIPGGGRLATWVLLSPLSISIRTSPSSLAPGVPASFSTAPNGGLAPFNETWQFGDGSAPVTGASVNHTYAAAGTFGVTLAVQDAIGELVTAATTVVIHTSLLTVSIQSSASSVREGTAVILTAGVAGGSAPYVYAWSAPMGICGVLNGPTLRCSPVSSGTLQLSLTVSDASGQRVSAGFALPVTALPGGATSPTAPRTSSTAFGWIAGGPVLVAGLVTLVGAIALGLLLYFGARHRTRRLLAERPLCYAVPAWSETPPEFQPPH